MSSIDLATLFKIGMYLLGREKRSYAFPRAKDIIQVLDYFPTDKRHIKGKLSDSFTNYNYVGNTKVSVSIKKT